MIKLVHEDTSATHVYLTKYFKAIHLLTFQNSNQDWKAIHDLMTRLLYYANPEVVLKVNILINLGTSSRIITWTLCMQTWNY